MTLDEAIDRLREIRVKHGGQVLVYFDCPRCNQSFAPSLAQPVVDKRITIPAVKPVKGTT